MACCKKRDFDTSHEVFFDKLQCINKKDKKERKKKKWILTHLMKYVTTFWCSIGVLNANALT